MVMLGGAWVPSFIFPPWLQTVSMWMPTHWAVDGLDAMTWRGLPLQDALLPVAAIAGLHAPVLGRGAGALPVGGVRRRRAR